MPCFPIQAASASEVDQANCIDDGDLSGIDDDAESSDEEYSYGDIEEVVNSSHAEEMQFVKPKFGFFALLRELIKCSNPSSTERFATNQYCLVCEETGPEVRVTCPVSSLGHLVVLFWDG